MTAPPTTELVKNMPEPQAWLRRHLPFHKPGDFVGVGVDPGPIEPDGERLSIQHFVDLYIEKVKQGTARNEAGFGYLRALRDERYTKTELIGLGAVKKWVTAANQAAPKSEPYTMGEAAATMESVFTRPAREQTRRGRGGPSDDQLLEAQLEDFDYFRAGGGMNAKYVSFLRGGRRVTCQAFLNEPDSDLHYELTNRFLNKHGRAPKPVGMTQCLSTINARCAAGPEKKVFIRIAKLPVENMVYVDLCDAEYRAVEITSEGWRIVRDPPVNFIRLKGMEPLPEPVPGGSLEDLRPLVNGWDPDNWLLMKAWMLTLFQLTGAVVHLALIGEAGALKSTTGTTLARLVQPSALLRGSAPGSEKDAVIMAMHMGAVLFLDNLSWVGRGMSDMFCQFSTGGSYQLRTLYSTLGLTMVELKIPMILNGIDDIIRRDDLTQRTIVEQLEAIPEDERRTEADVEADFQRVWPGCLGALFDIVATGLHNRATTKVSQLPRMADWAAWVQSCEPALGCEPGDFMAAYRRNQKQAEEVLIENDAVAMAILEWAKTYHLKNSFRGPAEFILKGINIEPPNPRPKGWPASAQEIASRLRRLIGPFKSKGLHVEHKRTHAGRLWTFNWTDTQRKLFEAEDVGTKNQEREAAQAMREELEQQGVAL